MSAFVSIEDRNDIEAVLAGCETAAERLYRRYEPMTAQQMWRFSRDPVVHQELVQAVWVDVFLNLAKFKGKAPLLHWIRRIATYTGYRFWKKEARDRDRKKVLKQEAEGAPSHVAATSPSEAAEQLHHLLAALAPDHRLVLTLFYFDECSVREIADRTGWSLSKVKISNMRARAKLKTLMEKQGYERP